MTDASEQHSKLLSAAKRCFDVVAACGLLLILSPLLALLALAVLLDSGWPVLFRQERLGLHGRVFSIYKFRTMIVGAEGIGSGLRALRGDPRITRMGVFLRRTSLDELPQLMNVIKGEMSLVGPRPPATYHPYRYDSYPVEYQARFQMKPGLTGLSQTEGRNSLTWQERCQLDAKYVAEWSFVEDLRILVRTVVVVFRGFGVVGDEAPRQTNEGAANDSTSQER